MPNIQRKISVFHSFQMNGIVGYEPTITSITHTCFIVFFFSLAHLENHEWFVEITVYSMINVCRKSARLKFVQSNIHNVINTQKRIKFEYISCWASFSTSAKNEWYKQRRWGNCCHSQSRAKMLKLTERFFHCWVRRDFSKWPKYSDESCSKNCLFITAICIPLEFTLIEIQSPFAIYYSQFTEKPIAIHWHSWMYQI